MALHLLALYLPGSPGASRFDLPGLDKVAHIGLFAVPAYLLCRLGAPWWAFCLLFAHAPISELIQWKLIPHRSGDPFDVAADLIGVGLGWWLARGVTAGSTQAGAQS